MLHEHFTELKGTRGAGAQGTVYVLEHPLSQRECNELANQLRLACNKEGVHNEHWLPWLVITTELGYSYSGTDYWPRLESKFPKWQYGDRERLASWFKRFAKEFCGVRPTGAWARQFRLIAWPITHAVLPTDLQVQLSRAVYAARHALFDLDEKSDEELGQAIASRWVPHGDRFDRLLQREGFVGTLVRLLLHPSCRQDVLSSHVLQRIVTDVEAHAEAKWWLRDARTYCRPSIRVAGAPARGTARIAPLRAQFSPDLVLEQRDTDRWSLFVKPQSALGLIAEAPSIARSLGRMRFLLSDNTKQAFLARELMKAEPRALALARFPADGAPLLSFLPENEANAALLTAESRLAPREVWIFKRRNDGSAWLQSSNAVLPGATYLLGTRDPNSLTLGEPQVTGFSGLSLRQLVVAAGLSAVETRALLDAGISVSKRTTIYPWGVMPRVWREDGLVEYVHGETVLLRVERDHAFDAVRMTVGGEPAREVSCPGAAPFLLELADLPLGQHTVTLDTMETRCTRSVTEIYNKSSITLYVRIRPPSSWSPQVVPSEALAVTLVPEEPSLKQVLQGELELSVQGTAYDTLEVSLVIVDGTAERHERTVLRRRPPITSADWNEHLDVARRDSDLQLHSLAATYAFLIVGSDRFGWHREGLAVFPRPLRWCVKRDGVDYRVCLRSDDAMPPEVRFYPRRTPCVEAPVAFAEVHRGMRGGDGLYLAQQGDHFASLVLSSPPAKMNLAELHARSVIEIDESDPAVLVSRLQLWSQAQTVGRLANGRLAPVIAALRTRLVHVLAGHAWAAAEQRALRGRRLSDLDVLVSPTIRNYGINLGTWRGRGDLSELKERFVAASEQYSVASRSRAELAWRLVFNVPTAQDAREVADPIDSTLQTVIRGARLIALGHQEGTPA